MPIYKDNGKWYIANVKGSHDTKAAAERRLRAIKADQARRGKKKSHR